MIAPLLEAFILSNGIQSPSRSNYGHTAFAPPSTVHSISPRKTSRIIRQAVIESPVILTAENSSLIAANIDSGMNTILLTVVALIVVVAAQTLINSMLDGDQGLRAYLSDGSGYNKSKFVRRTRKEEQAKKREDDPLSWLPLPKLDFVEVAGQEEDAMVMMMTKDEEALVMQKLEGLAERLRSEIDDGEKEKAKNTAVELELLMKKYGFTYENI